jgi:hypothetical protein
MICFNGLPLDLSTVLVLEIEKLEYMDTSSFMETRTFSTKLCAVFKMSASGELWCPSSESDASTFVV